MATLMHQGVELGEPSDFETWVETRQGGGFSRRCQFSLSGRLSAVDLKSSGLWVRLEDGSVWDLRVLRSSRGADACVYVTSAQLEPVPRGLAA